MITKTPIAFIGLFVAVLLMPQVATSQCGREQMVINYNTNYIGSMVSDSELGWTGNVSSCNAGTISGLSNIRLLQRINYYRALVGLPIATSIDPISSAKCQEAALMMKANNALSHTPPTSWLCYSAAGAQGAGSSNLAMGSPSCHSSYSIDLYMRDNGVSSLGHRRWVIKPDMLSYGHGSTNTTSALYVFGASGIYPNVPFTAYPSPGYFPAPLLTMQTWSFSIPGANFSQASVSMMSPNDIPVQLTYSALPSGYGDNAIGFTPIGISNVSPYDERYTVTIQNVALPNGTTNNYSYDVIIAPVVYPPLCPNGQVWSSSLCECSGPAGLMEQSAEKIRLFPNPAQNELSLALDNSGGYRNYFITDAIGKIVVNAVLDTNRPTIDVSDLDNGLYYLHLDNSHGAGIKFLKY